MKFCRVLFAVLISAVLCGCSIFVPHTQKLEINGNHTDAEVIVNGKKVEIPAVVEVPRDKKVFIIITKEGYYPCYETINTTLSTCGFLDVAGGFFIIVPFVGLFFPGAQELERDNFYFVLQKDTSAEANVLSN